MISYFGQLEQKQGNSCFPNNRLWVVDSAVPTGKVPSAKPATGKDLSDKPATGKDSSDKPATGKDSSDKPATGKDPSAKPETGKDLSAKPGTVLAELLASSSRPASSSGMSDDNFTSRTDPAGKFYSSKKGKGGSAAEGGAPDFGPRTTTAKTMLERYGVNTRWYYLFILQLASVPYIDIVNHNGFQQKNTHLRTN